MVTCAACGEEVPDGARFCPSCGRRVDEPEAAGERKLATMLFADLVGSTALTVGRDPEDVQATLARYFEVARAAVAEHGGTVEKFIGDAVMAVFGVPAAHGDDPDRAVAAALALRDRVGALPGGLELRVGVATGEVLALGTGSDLAVTGEAVNAAARVQQAAAPGQVLVDRRTASACRAATLRTATAVPAKGFADPLEVFEATGATGGAPARRTPLVGRDDDLDLLRLLVRRAFRTPAPALVTLVGEAGIGKTRLSQELVGELRDGEATAPRVLVGRNPPYGRGIAFWALGEIVRTAAGSGPGEPPAEVRRALAARLEAAGADGADEVAGGLALALGEGGDGTGRPADEVVRRCWRQLLAVLAAERPLVIVLEDVHWADEGLLDLVEESVRGLAELPLVVLCTSRPELLERRPDWTGGLRGATSVELRPLASEQSRALARALLPGADAETADRVARAAGGNPFFTEEVAQSLVGDAASETLPDTVQAALAARIDTLPRDEKQALMHAAVLGPSFTTDALSALLDADADPPLRELGRRELVVERPAEAAGAHGFRHQLVRDVAYAAVPRGERARLHDRAAEWLEDNARRTERMPELAEVISFHREQAHALAPDDVRRAAAAAAVARAAELAFARGASSRAQELYACAAELAPEDRERVGLLRAGAQVAMARMRGDQAVPLYRAAADAAQRAGDGAAEAIELATIVELHTRFPGITAQIPPLDQIRALIDRAQDALPADEDVSARARVALAVAWMATVEESDEAPSAIDRAVELSRQADDPLALTSALDALSSQLLHEGRVGAGRGPAEERLALLDRLPQGTGVATVERRDTLSMVLLHRLRVSDLPAADEALAWIELDEPDEPGNYARWSVGLELGFMAGRWDKVLADLERFRLAWEVSGRPKAAFARSDVLWGAVVHGLRGDDARWQAGKELAAALAEDPGRLDWAPWRTVSLLCDGLVLVMRGRPGAALESMSVSPEGVGGWYRGIYAAQRGDAAVRSRAPEAEAILAESERILDEDPMSELILARARALHHGDAAALPAIRAELAELGLVLEAARTGLDIGGSAAAEARAELARLGVAQP